MSQSSAVRTTTRQAPRHHGGRPAPAPRLRVVGAPAHTRSRAGLVVGCLTLLAVGLVGLLLLNVSLERGAYALRDQGTQTTALQEQRQALMEQLEALQAPQSLAARASALGMVPARNAAFLRASDGRILGVPAPGVAPPTAKPSTPATASTPTPGAGSAAKPTGAPTTASGKATTSAGATSTRGTTATKKATSTTRTKHPTPPPAPSH